MIVYLALIGTVPRKKTTLINTVSNAKVNVLKYRKFLFVSEAFELETVYDLYRSPGLKIKSQAVTCFRLTVVSIL